MTLDFSRIEAALPDYEIEGIIGHGGFGLVLAGRHRYLDRRVAIKMLVGEGEDVAGQSRFAAEARLLERLSHQHIVRMYNYTERDDLRLLVMERLGASVRARARAGMTLDIVVAVGLVVAAALECAHAQDVFHRDIKPDNMLFADNGYLKITDFGIAKILEATAARTNTMIGTPLYMAPEQFTLRDVGPGTDLYSLGVVLFELLSGATPFPRGLTPVELQNRHLHAEPPPLPTAPPTVAAVVRRAMAKNIGDRQASARDFAVDLAAAAGDALGPDWLDRCPMPVEVSRDVREAARTGTQPATSRFPAGQGGAQRGAQGGAHGGGAAGSAHSTGAGGAGMGAHGHAGAERDGSGGVGPSTAGGYLGGYPAGYQGGFHGGYQEGYQGGYPSGSSGYGGGAGLLGAGSHGGPATPPPPPPPPSPPRPSGNPRRRSSLFGRDRRTRSAPTPPPHPGGSGQLVVATPYDLAGAPDGSLFVSQPLHHRVSWITVRGELAGSVGTGKAGFAGDGGHAFGAELNLPYGIAVDRAGVLYIADYFNNRVRRVGVDGRVGTWVGSGLSGPPMPPGVRVAADQVALNRPRSVAVDAAGVLYITSTDNHQVVRVTPDGAADLLAGSGAPGFSGDGDAAVAASLSGPHDVAVAAGGIIIADTNNRRVRYVGADGQIMTVAGTGFGGSGGPSPYGVRPGGAYGGASGGGHGGAGVSRADQADLGRPVAVEFSPRNTIVVTDPSQHRILEITPDGLVRTLAGTGRAGASADGVPAATASLDGPHGITVGPDASVYLAETGRHRIRVITPTGILTTLTPAPRNT